MQLIFIKKLHKVNDRFKKKINEFKIKMECLTKESPLGKINFIDFIIASLIDYFYLYLNKINALRMGL
jgi:hypothetical protein